MSNPEVSNWIVWQRAWLFVRMFPASLGWLLLGVVLAVQDWLSIWSSEQHRYCG